MRGGAGETEAGRAHAHVVLVAGIGALLADQPPAAAAGRVAHDFVLAAGGREGDDVAADALAAAALLFACREGSEAG